MSTIPQQIAAAAPSYGVPTSIALAVAQKESGFNQGAIGAAGEVGVFQLMPGTASDLGVDPSNLSQNINGGLSYLSSLFRQFGNWTQALQAYNGGPGNVARGTVSTAARQYADSILGASASDYSTIGSDSGFLSPTASDQSFPLSLDLSGSSGLSGVAWAALAVAGIGLMAVILSR